MARKVRVEFPGAVYHVMARGNERARIFYSDGDRRMFLEVLDQGLKRFDAKAHAYCLMPNHYHLALETPGLPLSRLMAWVQTTFTVRYNRARRRCGHLFQGRYRAELVEEAEYAVVLARYIHLNPVRRRRAGRLAYVGGMEEVNAFRWSSHRAWAGLEAAGLERLSLDWLAHWGQSVGRARRGYLRELAEELGRGKAEDWRAHVREGLVAGGAQMLEKAKRLLASGKGKAAGEMRLARVREARAERAERLLKVEADPQWRMWLRVEGLGERRVDVAKEAGYADGSGVTRAIERLEARAMHDREQGRKLARLRDELSDVKD